MDTQIASRLAYVGSKPSPTQEGRDSDAWFTPKKYVDAARSALGGTIDLDPFSDPAANKVVQASRIFTIDDDALSRSWEAVGNQREQTVWMNPPYGKPCPAAVGKFLHEYEAGHFSSGIVLTNNATETRWFQALLAKASAICLTHHRIAFYNVDGKAISGNTRGQTFFYFGKDDSSFQVVFSEFGFVTPIRNQITLETT
jgi:hypothetical protein